MTAQDESGMKRWWQMGPLGMLAFAAFIVCTVTGIMLVPVYRPERAFDSIALLLLKNPAGVAVRSLHYWSAQIFLALTLAHIVEHFLRKSETGVQFGMWLRLALCIPAVFAAMLTGFLLRGDTAATQALQVLRSLISFVPFIGAPLARLLTGAGQNLTVAYLHHAATFTIVIWLVTIEHARIIMPKARAVLIVLPPVLALSLFLVPGLRWQAGAVEKGPWYLIGLQEFLHWMPWPQLAVWIFGASLLLIILLPKFPSKLRCATRWAIAGAAVVYVLLTVIGLVFRGDGWRLQSPGAVWANTEHYYSARSYLPVNAVTLVKNVPTVSGRREGCLACHDGMQGFVASHDPKTVGCASCHLGNPLTLNKTEAHAGMTLTPGNLSVVNKTCGASNCHADVAYRIHSSLMNSMSGVVAVDKVVFGEGNDLDATFKLAELKHSPADTHLRQLCASCHLGQDKEHPAPIDDQSRGGGCSACHLRYDAAATAELGRRGAALNPVHHPDISIHTSEQACFGCHSRSGRISTNYEGWHETQHDENAAKKASGWPSKFRLLADGRVFEKHLADVHFEKGMTCVDCHVAAEVMSDGTVHAHERDAIKIACIDCHSRGETAAREYSQLDDETQQIVAMRKLNVAGRRFVSLQSGARAYPNTFLNDDGKPLVELTESGRQIVPKPAAAVCAAKIHQRLDCGACHAAWAPQCVSCHTSFNPNEEGWDHLADRFVKGAWQEAAEHFESDAPALGVMGASSSSERITTFAPGMVMDLEGATGKQFQRRFAPTSPHTTAAHSRNCLSCHANPNALGYGRGELKYVVRGSDAKWQFVPSYPASQSDGLPQDAWIEFLREPHGPSTTRKNARPFKLFEQRKILLVGACLQCHKEKEPRIAKAFADFGQCRSRLSPRCLLPAWAGEVFTAIGQRPGTKADGSAD